MSINQANESFSKANEPLTSKLNSNLYCNLER